MSGSLEADQQRPAYPIDSVDNALRLLLMFREQPAMRVADVSRSIGVARSTAHRLLAMLLYHRFVVQDAESRTYRAGPALIDIGLAAVRSMDVRALARPLIEDLASRVDETVHLAVLDSTDVVFIDSVESKQVVRVGSRVGVRLPAHLTSLGKTILAAMPREQVIALYPTDVLPGRTPRSIVRRETFLRSLDEIGHIGYATNEGESEEGVGAIGMAVLDSTGAPRAAISVSAPTPRLDESMVEAVLPHLRTAVVQLGHTLN